MTRIGKIARLPHELREQLNRRLQDGEPGTELVGWLNGLPEVKTVLAEHFAGRPITEQNLSEWKTGGYGDWLAHQQALEALGRLEGEVDELRSALGGKSVTELLAQWLAARCLTAARAWAQKDPTDPEAMRQLRGLCGEVMRLRRLELEAQRADTDEARMLTEQATEHRERHEAITREVQGAMRLYALGLRPWGWDEGEKAEGERLKAKVKEQTPGRLNPTESGPIRPNPTKSDREGKARGNVEGQRASGERGSEGGSKGESRAASGHQPSTPPPSTLSRGNPTESDQIQPDQTTKETSEGTQFMRAYQRIVERHPLMRSEE